MNALRHVLVSAAILACAATTSAAQESFVQRALADSSFAWKSIASDRARIYYQEHSFAARHRAMILRSMTKTVDEVLTLLEEPDYDSVVKVFYLDSREQMERIIGHRYSGYSVWSEHAVFVVLNPEWRSFEKHEFTHVVTLGVWGNPDDSSRWMVEGISVYADGWCREYSVDQVAYRLLSDDRLPPLQELFDDPASLGEIRAGFYAASVIGYIKDKYGVAALRKIWSGGTDTLEDALGVDTNQLGVSWRSYLKKNVDADVHVDMDAIESSGCG
jgi:hypothetical protein